VYPPTRSRPGEVDGEKQQQLGGMEVETGATREHRVCGEDRINRQDAKDAKRKQKAKWACKH